MEWLGQSGRVFEIFLVEQVVCVEGQCDLLIDRVEDTGIDNITRRFIHVVFDIAVDTVGECSAQVERKVFQYAFGNRIVGVCVERCAGNIGCTEVDRSVFVICNPVGIFRNPVEVAGNRPSVRPAQAAYDLQGGNGAERQVQVESFRNFTAYLCSNALFFYRPVVLDRFVADGLYDIVFADVEHATVQFQHAVQFVTCPEFELVTFLV